MIALALICSLAALTSAFPNPASVTASNKTIVQLAEETPELSTLVKAVVAAGLADTLSGPGPFTVFAPTNDAFAQLPAGVLQKLLEPENKKELVEILTFHVVAGNIQAKDIHNDEKVKTVEGSSLTTLVKDEHVYIEASSRNIARVIEADVEASNGVVHIVSEVLIPPAPGPAPPAPHPSNKTIVQLAEEVPELSILVKAVVAAGLAETLSGPGPFTVFAPTNDAFEKLPAGTLQKLLEPANRAELVKILTFHVAAADVQAKDIHNDEQIKTVEGGDLTAYIEHDEVVIRGGRGFARVIKADVEASNGVVHLIDAVLLPADETATLKIE